MSKKKSKYEQCLLRAEEKYEKCMAKLNKFEQSDAINILIKSTCALDNLDDIWTCQLQPNADQIRDK